MLFIIIIVIVDIVVIIVIVICSVLMYSFLLDSIRFDSIRFDSDQFSVYVSRLKIRLTPASVHCFGLSLSVSKVAVKTNVGPLKVV